jgi:16S rRNA processing protein RimM
LDLVAIAKIAKPRGLKGELVADILTDFPERFDGLEGVTAVMPDASTRELSIEDHWPQGGRMVLKFVGVDSVESAENLRNAEICIGESEAIGLEDGEFYDWQLEGCEVKTVDGHVIGNVRGLMRTGATEILIIDGDKEYLVPFATSICTEVDIKNKLIVIDPPEGLLEF